MTRYMTSILIAAALASTASAYWPEDLYPPPWRGLPLTVQAEWEFMTPWNWEYDDVLPEYLDCVGDGIHELGAAWTHAEIQFMYFTPDPTEPGDYRAETGEYMEGHIGFYMVNWEDEYLFKPIWVQITYGGQGRPDVYDVAAPPWENPIHGVAIEEIELDENHRVERWLLEPNPDREFIYMHVPLNTWIDEVIIDTISSNDPWPPGPIPNDDCQNATPIGEVTDMPYSTKTATHDGASQCWPTGGPSNSPNIWYVYTPSYTGTATITYDPSSPCGSSFLGAMAVYDGDSCDPLGELLYCEPEDGPPCVIDVVAGQQYLIEMFGLDPYTEYKGTGSLTIACEPGPPEGWDDAVEISDDSDDWMHPRIATKGPWVHAVWMNDANTKLMYRRSRDGGRTWESIRQLYGGAGVSYPMIDVSGKHVHIVYEIQNSDIYYLHSDNRGETFDAPVLLTTPETKGYEPHVASAADTVYVIWMHEDPTIDILFRRSFDNGETWDPVTQNLTIGFAPPNNQELSHGLAAMPLADDTVAVCVVWVEVDWPDVRAYASYSTNSGDDGSWTGRYPLWHEQEVDWRRVAIAGGLQFYVDRSADTPQGPLQRSMDPFDGMGWSTPTSIGAGGNVGLMDGSFTYDDYACSVYSRNNDLYVSTGPGTEVRVGTGNWEGVAGNNNGNMHVVWDSSDSIYYRRYVGDRQFEHRGKPYPLDGYSYSDAKWGDLDGDGDMDVVVCGDDGSGSQTKTCLNRSGTMHAYQTLPGVQSTNSDALALGDYDNDGDLDLAMAGMDNGGARITRIYNNDGTGAFTHDISQVLPGLDGVSLAWGDYDNDGDLDLYIQGSDGVNRVAKLYENNPLGTLTVDTSQVLTQMSSGSADWVDYDGDGDLDLVVTGHDGDNYLIIFYENDPVGTLTNTGDHDVPGVNLSDTAWGDYDNDGDMDLAITGCSAYSGPNIARVYENNGAGVMTQAASLMNIYRSSCAWGDYDNDGDLDLALCGYDGGYPGLYTRIYEKTVAGFSHAFTFPGVREGSVSWADVDDDGNLDFFLTGFSWGDRYVDLYANVGGELNTLASAPSSFDGDSCAQGMRLSWNGASDDETAAEGLYYCLRVGRDPGDDDTLSGTDSTPLMGNVHEAYEWMLDVPVGRYYWQVRTIDAGLMHSDWSEIEEYIYCPGDLDGDGDIDLSDLAALLAKYGDTGVVYEQGDIDCDGDVDLADLAALLSVYGDDCLN